MILAIASIAVLVYSALIQVQILVVNLLSGIQLRRNRLATRFGRLEDLLSSDLAPPVSIIVPAYNEEAGIVEAVRSMTMLRYPRFEIVVVNDGSKDGTLEALIGRFRMQPVTMPHRNEITTAPIRQVYRSTLPVSVTLVDKENGGRADALNAGTNVARSPYVLLTDADVVLDGECLLRVMRHVVEDRVRTVAVGGNVRPVNGCTVKSGRVTETRLATGWLELVQVLEYIRSFIGSRPGWSRLRGMVLISGAFGLYRRDVLAEAGGLTKGHLGEDLDLTMRIHRMLSDRGEDYRIVYAPDAVAWTEVPSTRKVLRTQRIRWHRGLMRATADFWPMLGRPRYGSLGMVAWPAFLAFEFLAPIVEFVGYLALPWALLTGHLDPEMALLLIGLALSIGMINSLVALFMDEAFGYFDRPLDAAKLLLVVLAENFGIRQQTVLWRIRALFGGKSTRGWGDMQRRGVANLTG